MKTPALESNDRSLAVGRAGAALRKAVLCAALCLAPAFAALADDNPAPAPADADTNLVAATAPDAPAPESPATDAPAEEPRHDNWDAVAKFFNDLGTTCGIGFALLSVLGLGCVLERFANLTRRHIVPDGFTAEVVALWRGGKFEDVERKCAASRSVLARVVETMLEHRASNDYQEVKLFAEDKAGRELSLEERKSQLIAVVATVAPMLGLFGTVLGLRDAFGRVAAVGDMGNPAILADSINLALVTTVVGLALAMPALLVYNYFKNRLALYTVILEEEIADLVGTLFIKR